jgi:hypothetical protein
MYSHSLNSSVRCSRQRQNLRFSGTDQLMVDVFLAKEALRGEAVL